MSRRSRRFVVLCGAALMFLGCLAQPEQPGGTQSYALIVLPEAIQLLALDTQTFDNRARVREFRVASGPHNLSLAYVGNSVQHAGQQAEPFLLHAQAGQRYVFEAKT